MTILEAVIQLRPGTSWHWDPENQRLTQVNDGSPSVVPPTMLEINAQINAQAYIEKRVAEYPSMGDQLEALWLGGQAAADMKTKVMAVKTKYPKGA